MIGHLGSAQLCRDLCFNNDAPANEKGAIDLTWQEHLASEVKTTAAAKSVAPAKLEEAKQLVEEAIRWEMRVGKIPVTIERTGLWQFKNNWDFDIVRYSPQ